jgi:hypothetical protein
VETCRNAGDSEALGCSVPPKQAKPSGYAISLEDFEREFRHLVPSIADYRMKPANGCLTFAVKRTGDFYKVVRAAASANIVLKVGWSFAPQIARRRGIDCCFLKFDLADGCDDERLFFFIEELKIDARREAAQQRD